MKNENKYIISEIDKKGRVHIPKYIRKNLELENDIILEIEDDKLIIKPMNKIKDPVKFLSSINIKTKKYPAEMKREAESVFYSK